MTVAATILLSLPCAVAFLDGRAIVNPARTARHPAVIASDAPLESVATDLAPTVMDDTAAEMEALKRQIEALKLKAEIQQLQAELAAQAAAAPDSASASKAAIQAAPAASDAVSASSTGISPVAGVLLLAALVPVAYLGANKFGEFIESRYADITGGSTVDSGEKASSEPRKFAPPSEGTLLANQLWSEREAEREMALASAWDEDAVPGDRSAPDIVFTGLTNLLQDPTGWFFGGPSPLYSNVPVRRVLPPMSEATQPISSMVGVVAPTAPSDPTAGATRRERRMAGRAAKKAARKRRTPSTPEELDRARAGDWDYYGEAE